MASHALTFVTTLWIGHVRYRVAALIDSDPRGPCRILRAWGLVSDGGVDDGGVGSCVLNDFDDLRLIIECYRSTPVVHQDDIRARPTIGARLTSTLLLLLFGSYAIARIRQIAVAILDGHGTR